MASYTLLTFIESRFKDKMMAVCDQALDCAVKVIQSNEFFEGGDVKYLPLHEEYDGYVEITANDLKAWLVEYGTGEYMRTDNPYLAEYKRSKYYNNLRRYRNDAILYRGKQPYTQLNYSAGSGEVTRIGSNPAGKRTHTDSQPEPFLEELMAKAYKAFEDYMNDNADSIDLSDCFETKTINV